MAFSVGIGLTNACNLACAHCYRPTDRMDYVPLEQICLSPQCGFASTEEGNALSEDQQWQKVRLVTSIAADVW